MAQKLKRLTAKQQEFVRALASRARGNQTKAAKMAGYSDKNAKCIGSELMGLPHVAAAYHAIVEKKLAKYDITEDWIERRLAAIADADPVKMLAVNTLEDAEELSAWDTAAVQRFVKKTLNDGSGDVIIDAILCDKLAALTKLAQMKGMLRHKYDVRLDVSLEAEQQMEESFLGRMVGIAAAIRSEIVLPGTEPDGQEKAAD